MNLYAGKIEYSFAMLDNSIIVKRAHDIHWLLSALIGSAVYRWRHANYFIKNPVKEVGIFITNIRSNIFYLHFCKVQ